MQTSPHPRRTPKGNRRILLLVLALAVLAAIFGALLLIQPAPTPEVSQAPVNTSVPICEHDWTDVVSVTIRRGEEAPWTATVQDETVLISGDEPMTLSLNECKSFLYGASSIVAEDALTDNPADYSAHLADYGLDNPRYEANIQYADGTEITLRVGDKGYDGAWRYMLISGDNRLFAFSNGSVDELFVNRDTLRKVSQPDLHKARINRITLTEGDRIIQWTLAGDITDADAADKWRITEPFVYPADADAVAKLLTSIANLRLSAYVAPVTPENLTKYGFDTPRLTIDVRQAAGAIAVTGSDGGTQVTDYPANEVTFVIGGEKSDMVDYVRCGDGIYLSSHFTVGMFIGYDVSTTMSRYLVLTALGNLASLAIDETDAKAEYILARTEQVAANNELITDESGNVVCHVAVTKNGVPLDYTAFETAYNALAMVTVSGTLPAGEAITAEPHTVYTFTDVDGTVHTVALATFDVLHDAVIVDGHAAFYLIKGGFRLKLD